jgi:hypothetical protein
VLSSDLPGVNPATLNGMILYYRLMTKRSGLGDSTELSRMGLSHFALQCCGGAVEERAPVAAARSGLQWRLPSNQIKCFFSKKETILKSKHVLRKGDATIPGSAQSRRFHGWT